VFASTLENGITSDDFLEIKMSDNQVDQQHHYNNLARRIALQLREKIKKHIVRKHCIKIADYPYVQKYRESLAFSPIRAIMEKEYLARNDMIFDVITGWKQYRDSIDKISPEPDTGDITMPYWNNSWFPPGDAISLYCTLARNNPRYYVECGSGNSTKFAGLAIKNHTLRTRIISIDPCPRTEIDPLCHTIYRCGLEAMNIEFFKSLTEEDILLVDTSHRAFPNSDVTVFFTEILSSLPSGLLYALHDIFLPYDYPVEWIELESRSYNEQYMLATYILGGKMGDSLVLPMHFLSHKQEIKDLFKSVLGYETGGGLCWLQKR
jgi:hypothetical protein